MPTRISPTRVNDKRKRHINPERPPQRNDLKQLQNHKVPMYHAKNTNGTNNRRVLILANKPRVVLWGTENIPQRIKRHRSATIHWLAHLQQEQVKTEKSSYGLDWPQKGIWFGSTKLENELFLNVQEVINFIEKTMKNWRVEFTAGRKSLPEAKVQSGIFQGDVLSQLLSVIAMMSLNQKMHWWIQT